ncbi:MAG: pyruvate, phosphate dikinase [Magnetococcales bacterium]|nr:pyruvate, phosphate dikinase [Magnetococcales bacterium]
MTKRSRPPLAKQFQFATKADNLQYLSGRISHAQVCDQIIVSVAKWKDEHEAILHDIVSRFPNSKLAVRSSAADEDGWLEAKAGVYLSLVGIEPEPTEVGNSIDQVIASYATPSEFHQVLVQPMVVDVVISGVIMTRDLISGGPYYVINYDDFSGRTDIVTGGGESKAILVHRSRLSAIQSSRFLQLVHGVQEIEAITGSQELDIEFCIDKDGQVTILQVRPLAARRNWQPLADTVVDAALDEVRATIFERMAPDRELAGHTTILGEMPDWNPAEMIGNIPNPLALSLYKVLITDRTWAEARTTMGYRFVPRPLMVDLCGRPYIDTRLSFNSFLPSDLDEKLAKRLVDHQLQRLQNNSDLHDKVEFDIAVTCRDFSFSDRLKHYRDAGFSNADLQEWEEKLAAITRDALEKRQQTLDEPLQATQRLAHGLTFKTNLNSAQISKAIESIINYGTRPFAQLARHGFIGVLFLRSLTERGILSDDDAATFMGGIQTVATELLDDLDAVHDGTMSRAEFLDRYGHLRPGTYDICSYRYDRRPDLYLGQTRQKRDNTKTSFKLSSKQNAGIEKLLTEFGYNISPKALLKYITDAIKAREEAKFIFSHGLSDLLTALAQWGEARGLTREELSSLPITAFLQSLDPDQLRKQINLQAINISRSVRLPSLICRPNDVDVIRLPIGSPTFITHKRVMAPAHRLTRNENTTLDGFIVLIESADPGFDWIFSHNIKGLITKYGGVNSHMSIRCAEFDLPAAIGCGERLFDILSGYSVVELNCAARKAGGH